MRYEHSTNNVFPHIAHLDATDWSRWAKMTNPASGNGWLMVRGWLVDNYGEYRHTAGRDTNYFMCESPPKYSLRFRAEEDYLMFALRWC